ncbi:hypothetical protein A1O1_06255 [Capronia coronata CBS 617.96]|uniref:Uncharacterized protein n=1 Tax=Capronia coronata CBS 617.96 TaxID=1182541 RepID=W9Y9J4_9EURO|nr:uncharacterized protein A1O1_06255 [Capronia coronata CBS 617.96]EXJ85886.1 hypothetical protein A1O1_06255 [Capronia coronata CBS 617.96]
MVTPTPIRPVSRNKDLARETGMISPLLFADVSRHTHDDDRGREGEEVEDYGYNFSKTRRRSNSSTHGLGDFKTKFETRDADPVFEEQLHGPTEDDVEKFSNLSKEESIDSSTNAGSVDEEYKKM